MSYGINKDKFRELFTDRAEDNCYDVYQDYSGRCMYGDTCPAIDLDSLKDAFEFAAVTGLSGFTVDDMGTGVVIYADGSGTDHA